MQQSLINLESQILEIENQWFHHLLLLKIWLLTSSPQFFIIFPNMQTDVFLGLRILMYLGGKIFGSLDNIPFFSDILSDIVPLTHSNFTCIPSVT